MRDEARNLQAAAADSFASFAVTEDRLGEATVLAEGLLVPEGPIAMSDRSVVFVEIAGGRLSRLTPGGDVEVIADLGGGPNGAAVGPDGAIYVCNNGMVLAPPATFREGEGTLYPDPGRSPIAACIQRIDPVTGTHRVLYDDCEGRPFHHPNDIVFDASGGFWFTDYVGAGAIYYAAADGSRVERVLDDLHFPNGIGLSPDGEALIWAQTYTRQVLRRRIVAPGRLLPSVGHKHNAIWEHGEVDPFALLAGLPGGLELDSLALQADGSVCVGLLGCGGIAVFAADGSQVELKVPPPELADGVVTNICFGGEDMCTAFITFSGTGRLVACPWPDPGLQVAFRL